MEDLALPLNEQLAQPPCEMRRFSSDGAVVVHGSIASVFIGGLLIGTFNEDADDRGPRNILAVTLAKSGQLHLGHLASAFGMTDEYLRILRRKEEARGLGSVLGVRQGKVCKVSPELRAACEGPAVFYVDGHLRRYHGKQVVRKGWRMQDRRVLPGSTDYYVHDEDGRPVFRIPVTSHDSLSAWLQPIAKRLREGLGAEERILLAFDRGGAFSKQLAELRDAGMEFVTYERAPYPTIAESKFGRTVVVRGETYQLHESRNKNLGDKRGRIRRIALRDADGKQINLVAISTASAEQLVAILLGGPSIKLPSGRWQQENAFHHGDARWGINQLDDRAVEPYPPGTIIPNPARRRLDQSLRLARAAEGDARRKLACTTPELGALRRTAVEQDLADALALQRDLEALRPQTPTHAPIEETALAGKLVRHTGQLKRVVDVIRVVCANAESELATLIAPHMGRPREAKKVIANILAAPGKVTVTDQAIHVRLAPAANRSEREAMQHLFAALNQRGLVLPSDPKRLPLRFDLQPL
jgi:hypothetical protein